MTLRIITRAEWGARYPDGYDVAPLPAQYLWLHHSVTLAPDLLPPFDDDDAAVRLLELIGQQRFGAGMSYTFAVTPAGRVYQGVSLGRASAHTLGHNFDSRAVVLVGDYTTRRPTDAQLTAVAELVVLGRRNRWWTSWLSGGHRDAEPAGYTECPGDAGEAAIPEINRRAYLLATPIPTTEEDMGLIIVRADGHGPLVLTDGFKRRNISNTERAGWATAGVRELNLTGAPDSYDEMVSGLEPA